MGTKYDIVPLLKGTIDKYLEWRRTITQYPLPDPIPDNVYQALVCRGENPGSNKKIATEFNLTPEQERLTKNLYEGARNFRDTRRRGPIY